MTPVPESVEEAVKRVTAWLNDPVTGAYPIASPMRTILAALAQGPKEGDTITEGLTDCGEGEPFTPGSVGEDASMAAYAVLRCCDLISAGDQRVPDRIGRTLTAFYKDRPSPLAKEAEGWKLVPVEPDKAMLRAALNLEVAPDEPITDYLHTPGNSDEDRKIWEAVVPGIVSEAVFFHPSYSHREFMEAVLRQAYRAMVEAASPTPQGEGRGE